MNKLPLSLLALALLTACQEREARYDATGVFEAREVLVSARHNGELIDFALEEGQTVKAGEHLGQIDTTQLALQRRQLRASMSATQLRRLDVQQQVSALRQQLSNLQAERTRFAGLVNEKSAPQKQVDDLDHQLAVVRQQLAAQQAVLASTNASLSAQSAAIVAQIEQLDQQLRNTHIVSPVNGTVLATYAERGEMAVFARPLFRVADLRVLELRAYVSGSQLTALRLGQSVRVFADRGEADRKEYRGHISWISDRAEFTPKTIQTRDERSNLVYAIKVRVKNDGLLKRGMYAEVKF